MWAWTTVPRVGVSVDAIRINERNGLLAAPPHSEGEFDSIPQVIFPHCNSSAICRRSGFPWQTISVPQWRSRTRDLTTNAETYGYPAFREAFRELRREARKSEMELVMVGKATHKNRICSRN
jgi:hypothetical protein